MWKYPQSKTITSGLDVIELAASDNVWVSKYVFLANEDGDGIIGLGGAPHTVLVDGAIAASKSAIWLLSGGVVSISETGILRGGTGVNVNDNSEVNNQGQIVAAEIGISLYGEISSGISHVENSGSISAGTYGVRNSSGFQIVQNVILENSGTITGGIQSFRGANGSESVTNTGKMIGDIIFGSESDFYDGRKGYVKGVIDCGDGNDTIFGGKEANTISGGTGSDSIYGGRGDDELTGGADIDIFLFWSVKDSTVAVKGQDTITDFTHGEDLLEIQSIDFNSKMKGLQDPTLIGSKKFSHTAGELRYDHTSTDTYVYADINGDAKADFKIHLDGVIKLGAHDFFF